MLLPEKLVTVFTPNTQSLDGVLDLVARAVSYRRSSNDFRPLAVFPLPSRIELNEKKLKDKWRIRYQTNFEELFRRIYDVEECDLTAYFDEVQLPHMSYYAYGEEVAVGEERSDALSLGRAYKEFFRRLIALNTAWAKLPDIPTLERRTPIEYIDLDVEFRDSVEQNMYALSVDASGYRVLANMSLPRLPLPNAHLSSADEKTLTMIGRSLFDALFSGEIKDVYTRSWRTLQKDQRLRIKLDVSTESSEVAALPWELLYDPNRHAPLALSNISVVRYFPILSPTLTHDTQTELRILLTGASPQSLPMIDLERELSSIQRALADLVEYLHVQIITEAHLSTRKFQRLLRSGSFHIWHFVGHGGLSKDGTTNILYLENDDGGIEVVSAQQLGVLCSKSDLRLVVLNSGNSGTLVPDLSRSLAPTLIHAFVPAVIAMQYNISTKAALAFIEEFYRALAEGLPIDTCMIEGRKAIVTTVGTDRPDWASPVFYTSTPNSPISFISTTPYIVGA